MEKFNEKEKIFKKGESGPKYFIKGPYWEGGVIVLNPGENMGEHWHEHVEETFYFLSGTPKITANGIDYRVAEGDVFRLAVKDKHNIVNDTEKPIKLFFVKSPFYPNDKFPK